MASAQTPLRRASLREVLIDWGRLGCIGFGGPPAHMALLRELCVERRGWLTSVEFERALAACNLLPGPASTQLAIYCAWRVAGTPGALLGGACFIAPGLAMMVALSAVFLATAPPAWVRGAGLGAGAAVAAVAVRAGLWLALPIWTATAARRRPRVAAYALLGGVSAATIGPWLALVLIACGLLELAREHPPRALPSVFGAPALGLAAATSAVGGTGALVWTALKVGGLSFGGGFVIVPLMQADAVNVYHWMTHAQFLNAVALGQVTPGPVTLTIAAVGYAAGGVPAALLATAVAFAPSFSFIVIGAARFERLLHDGRVRAFMAGAAPAAAGAILGAAVPLAGSIGEGWQYPILAAAAALLLLARRGVVATLLLAACAGALAALAGAPLPS